MEVHQRLAAWGAAEVLPQQIALAHSGANLFIAAVCMPFLDFFAGLMLRLVPEPSTRGKRASDDMSGGGSIARRTRGSDKAHLSDHDDNAASSSSSATDEGARGSRGVGVANPYGPGSSGGGSGGGSSSRSSPAEQHARGNGSGGDGGGEGAWSGAGAAPLAGVAGGNGRGGAGADEDSATARLFHSRRR